MKVMRFLVVGATLAIAACSKPAATDKPADVAAVPTTPPLVSVNGKAISNELYEDYVKALTQGKASKDLAPEDREQIKENLVRMELIAQQAEKEGLTKDPEIAARIELSRINLLQQASAQKYLKDRTPTEAELRAEFEAQLATTPLVEYHARHILVSGEDVAIKIIEQLKSGADFASLAKRLSSDKQSAVKGGDLDWFPPNAMVKPFSDAVALLKNGEFTKTPVRTDFGWHVIQLLGTRDRAPPSFEAVQDQVKQIVLTKKFRAYSDELLKAAKVDPPLSGTPANSAPIGTPAPDAPVPVMPPAN
jgi:peptidyl-prolyl cis-trans isomerase C